MAEHRDIHSYILHVLVTTYYHDRQLHSETTKLTLKVIIIEGDQIRGSPLCNIDIQRCYELHPPGLLIVGLNKVNAEMVFEFLSRTCRKTSRTTSRT